MDASAIQKRRCAFSKCKARAIAKWLKMDVANHASLPVYGQVSEDWHDLIRIGHVASSLNR
jgi:hypothetical protein